MKLRKEKWKRSLLGDVCEIDPSKKELSVISDETLVSFAEMADLNERQSNFNFSQTQSIKKLRKGGLSYFRDYDVLLAKMTPCFENGKSGLVKNAENGIGFGSTEFFVLRSRKIDPYLLYSIISSNFFIDKGKLMMVGTTGRKRLMKDFVSNFDIPLPSPDEQKQLAELFHRTETAIDDVERQENNLKALQKSLINGLFDKQPVFGNLLNAQNCAKSTFGSLAECDKRYPEHANDVSRFVGLEFIEADNFKLQGWGEIANGTTFSKRFAKGDVLFGKRRAYLKKVAVADFDGICSGDILVIRANPRKMLQGLLPYYIAADAFIEHAVSTSAGSLSPRTKWKDLAELTVAIPDLKAQASVLETLEQIENTVKRLKEQKTNLKNLKQTLLSDIFE